MAYSEKLTCMQPGPVIPMPSQGRLAMPGQAQLPRARGMQMAGGYPAAAQPRRTQQTYVAAPAPARQNYTDDVRCCYIRCSRTCASNVLPDSCILELIASVKRASLAPLQLMI